MAEVTASVPHQWNHAGEALAMNVLSLAEENRRQILECEKIVKFRDEILAGVHPRIKVPLLTLRQNIAKAVPESNGLVVPSPPAFSSITNGISHAQQSQRPGTLTKSADASLNAQSFLANRQHSVAAGTSLSHLPGVNGVATAHSRENGLPASSSLDISRASQSRLQIAPVLLEKSVQVIAAEFRAKRKRLEHSLRDQYHHQQTAARKPQGKDDRSDLDLKDVLIKALSRVQTLQPQQQNDANLATDADDGSIDKDSFDDRTFYSSPQETPESRKHAPLATQHKDQTMRDDSDYEPPDVIGSAAATQPEAIEAKSPPPQRQETNDIATQAEQPTSRPFHITRSHPQPSATYYAAKPGKTQDARDVAVNLISSPESGEESASVRSVRSLRRADAERIDSSRTIELAQPAAKSFATHARDTSPVTSQLQPLRPPPSLASSLPTQVSTRAAPAPQVAIMREEVIIDSGPDNTATTREKTKSKKKSKRKSDKQGIEAHATAYIKPEPRSPSPLSAPIFAQPLTRVRQYQEAGQPIRYERVRYESVAPTQQYDFPTRVYRTDRAAPPEAIYSAPESYQQRHIHGSLVEEHARPSSPAYSVRRASEIVPSSRQSVVQYAEPRMASAMAQAPVEQSYRERTIHYADPYGTHEVARRADLTRLRDRSLSPRVRVSRAASVMPPPPAPRQPTRIVMDEFGREYLEPSMPPPSTPRYSVAPAAARYEQPELVYERRAPASERAGSVYPGVQPALRDYGERVVYRDTSPIYAGPSTRRVVTQPHPDPSEYAAYREREYSVRPRDVDLEQQHPRQRVVSERRPVNEPPVEYVTRSSSVRPVEPVRYEQRREYAPSRMQSVRPEGMEPAGEPVYAQSRYMMPPPPPQRMYSGASTEQPPPVVRRAYSVRPGEQVGYYEQPPQSVRPSAEGVTYVERRAAPPEQEVIYQDYRQANMYE